MAKKNDQSPEAADAPAEVTTDVTTEVKEAVLENVRVRLLVDCAYGKCNAVVSIPSDELVIAKEHGLADDNPDAIAYAESIAKQ